MVLWVEDSIAVGSGLTAKYKNTESNSVLFGDGAANTGAFTKP